jgi:hypothetical protein
MWWTEFYLNFSNQKTEERVLQLISILMPGKKKKKGLFE